MKTCKEIKNCFDVLCRPPATPTKPRPIVTAILNKKRNAVSTNAVSTNAVSINAVSTNAVSTNAVSTNAVSTNAVSTNAVSNK